MATFVQEPPVPGHPYTDDHVLRAFLKRTIPAETWSTLDLELDRFAQRVVTEVEPLGRAAEASPPVHVPFDAWGRRVDRVDVPPAWKALDRFSAEEGLVALAYEQPWGRWSRLAQFARLYLFAPVSAVYACPLAMTDGAARLIQTYGDPWLKDHVYPRLTSRDPDRFITSGQWMTERTGGSDVGRSLTIARREGDVYRLHGNKFFTSAITAPVAMTLARIEGAAQGSRGLSLFFVEVFDDTGRFNHIQVVRLKEKVGTRALPTAEIELQGTPARLVGGEGHGVRKIATLFNITRIYNAMVSVSFMRRALALARDYAARRVAFGRPLTQHPAHLETLADLEVSFCGAFALTFRLADLLGKEEAGEATADDRALLRLLTPIAKLYTARRAVDLVGEAIECVGGVGYLEDSPFGSLLRDVHVLPIWEGTTNILALDMLRALDKEGALEPFVRDTTKRLERATAPQLARAVEQIRFTLDRVARHIRRFSEEPAAFAQASARALAFAMAEVYAGSLLAEHAQWAAHHGLDDIGILAARRWADALPRELPNPGVAYRIASQALALDEPAFRGLEPASDY